LRPETCLTFAAQGALCFVPGAGATKQCDAIGFLKNGGSDECEGGQQLQCTYDACVEATFCENADNQDLSNACTTHNMGDPKRDKCVEQCMCPRGQSYDKAEKQCAKACPAVDQCESTIAADYLDSGANAAKCADTSVGATCKASCESFKCVPKPDQADSMERFCHGRAIVHQLATKPFVGGDYSSDICEWVGAGGVGARLRLRHR
jgi:hypothetical protein